MHNAAACLARTGGVLSQLSHCRIYRSLQEHALTLFHDSLRHGGFLCLGTKETLHLTSLQPHYAVVADKQKIYRKTTEAYAHVH